MDSNDEEIFLIVSDETEFFDQNKETQDIEYVEVGMKITGIKSTIATFSIPAQSSVYTVNIEL